MTDALSNLEETEQFSFIHRLETAPDSTVTRQSQDRRHGEDTVSQQHNSTALCRTLSSDHSSQLALNSQVTISDRWYTENNLLSTVIIVPEVELGQTKKRGFNYYLDRLMLFVAGGYLCLVFWWLVGHKNAMFPLPFIQQENTISQADAEFIEYMQRSLKVIDSKVSQQNTSETIAKTKKNQKLAANFVPVYTPKPNPPQNLNFLPPTTLLPPPTAPNQLTTIKPAYNTPATPIKTPIAPSESVAVKTTSIDESHVKPITEPSSKSKTVAAITRPKTDVTLVGIMELTEGSAALFKINGVTQRVFVKNKIENTGWTLNAITNQKVEIVQNQNKRIISVGENL